MPTSGTTGFSLDIRDIVEDAFELCGLSVRSGMDYRSARRSMDLLFIKWAQKGVNFWLIEERSTALTTGTETVDLDPDVLDVVEIYTRQNAGTQNQSDLHVKQIGLKDWAQYPTKKARGRPVNVWVEKNRDNPTLHLWPVPDGPYTLVYHVLTRIEDTGGNGTNDADVPWRFLPALVSGLALEIARKKAPDRIPVIDPIYREDWLDAQSADRERRPTRFSPNLDPYVR